MRWPRPNPLRRILGGTPVVERMIFSAAIFFLFASMGLITDVMSGGSQPRGILAANVVFAGTIALVYAWTAVLNPLLMPVPFAIHLIYAVWLVDLIPAGPVLTEWDDRRIRLRFDAVGLAAAMSLSYTCFLMFINRTGTRHVATQTEIALARDIHRVLVPPVDRRLGEFEFSGQSLPSGDVGGDLVDVVDLGGGAWLAYAADVSGHGVSSGLLMGMVKSAVRMRVRAEATAADLLTDLNAVLEPLKHPAMFVTLAVVTRDRAGALAFSLAGHLPILRIRGDGRVERVTISHLPVGMMPGTTFAQAALRCDPGDTLALLTDGLIEVFDRRDQEFGLERIERSLGARRSQPLSAMASETLRDVRAHGPQLDDQTWLLIRRVTS